MTVPGTKLEDRYRRFAKESGFTPGTRLAGNILIRIACVLLTSISLTASAQTQQAYLKASNAASIYDAFGFSVAVSENTVVVGADNESSGATGSNGDQDDISANNAGAAYVFVQDGTEWTQQAYLKASNTGANDYFGHSVSISGDTLAVSAPGEASQATGINGDQNDDSANEAGAVYIFVRNGSGWSQQAYIKASNTDAGDWFGFRVALSENTLLVGARHEDSSATGVNGDQGDNSSENSGAVYVFTRTGITWSQQAYLKASNTDGGDVFGRSLDISGETIVIGSAESSSSTGVDGDQDNNAADYAGAAYVFIRSGATWSQQAYLKASNTDQRDLFGYDVAISGDTVAIGAPIEASNATGIDGNQSDNSITNGGAAYVFTRNGGSWSQQAYIKASNTESGDLFGRNLALKNQSLVVSAEREDSGAIGIDGNQGDNSQTNSGAAYLFERSDGIWSMHSYIKASNTDQGDEFGWQMALSNNTLVVGAPGEDSGANVINGNQEDNSVTGAGAAYVFAVSTLHAPLFINPGFNDAWYNPFTDGQGFLISVFPDIQQMFVAWFTFDVERPAVGTPSVIGEPGHRWLIAQGPYSGGKASLTIYVSEGGVFDSGNPAPVTDLEGDGTLTLEFVDCVTGLVTYEITSSGLSGSIPIERIAHDNVALCEELMSEGSQ